VIWDGFELGPVLDATSQGELRLAYDLSRRQAVCLRYFRWVAGTRWSPLVQPDGPSPHLARVIEERLSGSEAWTERECCFGPTLDALASQGPASPSTVAAIATQVLQGLRDLHAAGGAHGSLSPATIVFDLASGLIRLVDLEAARLGAADDSDALMPSSRGDVAALGRICEGLLIGASDARSARRVEAAPHPDLLAWAKRLQETGGEVALDSAEAALHALAALGLDGNAKVSLPGGRWARRHSRALSVIARWKVAPPPAAARDRTDSAGPQAPLSYGQLRSSLIAEVWWKRIGIAGTAMLVLSGGLALSPRHGGASQPSFGDEACLERARPLSEGTAAQDRTLVRLQIDSGTAIALDGCPLAVSDAAADSGQSVALLVLPGRHELRAERNGITVDQTIEVRPGEEPIDVRGLLEAVPPAEAGEATANDAAITRFIDSTRAALRERTPAMEDGGARPIVPLQWGMIEPQAQWLVAEDERVFGRQGTLRSRTPDSLALALAALRSANERFVHAADRCEVKLRPTTAEELGSATSPANAETVAAAILVAGARVASGQLAEPLRVEQRGLERLGIGESPRLNRVVDTLLASPELLGCLQGLLPLASDVDESAGRVVLLLEGG
jgi:hypothetical protein